MPADDGLTISDEGSESEDEGTAQQALDGEAEGPPRRPANFDTLVEVFRFITGCNNGRGLSNESTVWLLNLLRDERLNLDLIRHWHTLHAVVQFGMTLLMSRRVYATTSFTIPGWPSPFEVTHTSGKEAVLEMFGNPENAEGFVLFATQENSAAGRVYTTPQSARYWQEAQKAAVEMFGEGAVVVPLILSSDATVVSGNERVRVGAVYISIANIPLRRRWLDCGKILLALLPFPPSNMTPAMKVELFQAAMKIVLADLIVASHTGLAATDPTGVSRFIVPLLFSYVADYPETCKVSCTQQLGSAKPCSLCAVDRKDLRDMDREAAPYRTVEGQEALLDDPEQAKLFSTLNVASFLWTFNFSRTLWGNTYLSQMPDILHAIYIGRMTTLYPDARLAGVRVPGNGHYWASGANFTASEHAAVMMIAPFVLEGDADIMDQLTLVAVLQWHESCVRATSHTDESLAEFETATKRMIQSVESAFPRGGAGWNLIKVHLMTHFPDAIRRGGLLWEYSAAVFENAHIRTCKLPYRASNHRQPAQAIAAHNVRASALAQLASALPGRRRNQTALVRAVASGTPQLTQARKSLTDRPTGETDAASVFEEIDRAVGGLLMYYDTVMRNAGLRSFPAWAHTAVALPALPTDFGLIRPHYARAAASLHGHTAFSCVEYETPRGETRYGRLLMLLDAEEPLDAGGHAKVEVAILQRLIQEGVDAGTGCQMLGVGSLFHGLAVIPIRRIKRAVHCVPSFRERDLWYLNKWAYFCTLEPY
ncbi:unnamed protein product [Closterium sp. NIES-64]|nr:unnamed protein product [Closterium sp. NIES-64]